MNHIRLAVILLLAIVCTAPPIQKKKPAEKEEDLDWRGKLSYNHYLTQVMEELEKDKDFSERVKKLRTQNKTQTMDLATQLTFVKHSVRTRLDELKRLELKRLNELERRLDILKAKRGDKDVPEEVLKMVDRNHIDHENPSSFEIDDLDKLIKRAIIDLKNIDEKQKEEFKRHEMLKEVEHRRKMKHIKDEKKRKEEEKKWDESQARHNKHEKIHTPGSEAQLKDVWEKEDHMDPDNFNSKTFFKLHDLNGDGELDEAEVEAMFDKELDKAYDPNDPDDDNQERYESMMEMRRNIMEKIDKNKDMRISFAELENWTKSPEFKQDAGFQLPEEDKSKIYSEEDLKKFQKEYDEENPDDEDEDNDDDEEAHHGAPEHGKEEHHGAPEHGKEEHHGAPEHGKEEHHGAPEHGKEEHHETKKGSALHPDDVKDPSRKKGSRTPVQL